MRASDIWEPGVHEELVASPDGNLEYVERKDMNSYIEISFNIRDVEKSEISKIKNELFEKLLDHLEIYNIGIVEKENPNYDSFGNVMD